MDDVIYWNRHAVGLIKDVGIDNFHVYGTWDPNRTSTCAEFLAVIEQVRDPQGDVVGEIIIGFRKNKPTHRVSDFRDGEIDILPLFNPPSDW